MQDVVRGALFALATYLAIGSIVAVALLSFGIARIDPAAKGAPWTFRALVFPGVVALWPVFAWRWMTSGRTR